METIDNRELAKNKLILLYLIDKFNDPINNLQVMKFILESKIMNYFQFQEFINELCDSELLHCKTVCLDTECNKTYYEVTYKGKQALEFFSNLIPSCIKTRIDNSIIKIKRDEKNETSIRADYFPKTENEYIVICEIQEDDFELVKLELTVGTKSDALDICNNWKEHAQLLYPEIIESLTKKR